MATVSSPRDSRFPAPAAVWLVLSTLASGAGAQISGTLEQLIWELPNGCGSYEPSSTNEASGSFHLDYTCDGSHSGTLSVSFPASVEATGFEATPNPYYPLASPANASASVAWTWSTPDDIPGGGLYFADVWLTIASVTACSSHDPKSFIGVGVHSFNVDRSCSVTGLLPWDSGDPSNTTARAVYTTLVDLRAKDYDGGTMFPDAWEARVSAIYRMDPPGPDLDVDIGGERTLVNENPVFPVTVTNRGSEEAVSSRLLLDITADLAIAGVTTDPPSACTWTVSPTSYHGDCHLAYLPAGDNASVSVTVAPSQPTKDLRVRMRAEAVPTDRDGANNVAEDTKVYLWCSEAHPGGDCLINALSCYSPFAATPPSGGGRSSTEGLLAQATAAVRSLTASSIDIWSFLRLRDEVLEASAAGRRLRALYETHTAEVTFLVGAHPDLLADVLDALLLWQPHVQALVDGRGSSAAITSQQLAALTGVIDQLKALASPELRAALTREEAALDIPTFAGKSMDEALARVEVTRLHRRLRRPAP